MWRVLSSMPPGKKPRLSLAPPLPTSTPTWYGTHGLVLQRGGTGSIFGGGTMLIVERLRHCQPGFSQAINRNGSGITGIKEFGADDAAGHHDHSL